jgi:hypothetical protein
MGQDGQDRLEGRDGEDAEKRKGWKVAYPPASPAYPPVQPSYLLNVPKNAERLFGSLHFVPSIAPLKLF